MAVLLPLAIIMFLAWLVETLTEAVFGEVANHIPAVAPYKWALIYVAMLVGVLVAWAYKFDLVYLLATFLKDTFPNSSFDIQPTWLGVTFTGLAIGRGSSFMHDLYTTYFLKRPVPPIPVTAELISLPPGVSVAPVQGVVRSAPTETLTGNPPGV